MKAKETIENNAAIINLREASQKLNEAIRHFRSSAEGYWGEKHGNELTDNFTSAVAEAEEHIKQLLAEIVFDELCGQAK